MLRKAEMIRCREMRRDAGMDREVLGDEAGASVMRDKYEIERIRKGEER